MALTDEQIHRLYEYRDAADLWPSSKPRSNRGFRMSNRSIRRKQYIRKPTEDAAIHNVMHSSASREY